MAYLHSMKNRLLILLFILGVTSHIAFAQNSPNYEFRGVWIATVENIDWPSKRNLSVAEQKASFIRLLDLHQSNGMNAIVMQIRPAGDAFYPSQYEPQRRPPVPFRRRRHADPSCAW